MHAFTFLKCEAENENENLADVFGACEEPCAGITVCSLSFEALI